MTPVDCKVDWFVSGLSQCRAAAAAVTVGDESSHNAVVSALYEHSVCQWPVCDTHCGDVSAFYK